MTWKNGHGFCHRRFLFFDFPLKAYTVSPFFSLLFRCGRIDPLPHRTPPDLPLSIGQGEILGIQRKCTPFCAFRSNLKKDGIQE